MVIFLYSERPVLYDEVFDLLYRYDFERRDVSIDMLRDEIVDFEKGDLLLADPRSLEMDDRILDLYRIYNRDVPFVIAAPKYPQSVIGEIMMSWQLPEAPYEKMMERKARMECRNAPDHEAEADAVDPDTDSSDPEQWDDISFEDICTDSAFRRTGSEEAAEVIQQLTGIILSLVQERYGSESAASKLCDDLIRCAERMRGIRRSDVRSVFKSEPEKNMLRGVSREHDGHVA